MSTATKPRRPRYVLPEPFVARIREWQFQSGHVVTKARQKRAICRLLGQRENGCTALELARITDPGDETAIVRWAPAFSLLHKEGLVCALAEKRDGYAVYVMPEYVAGRDTVPHYIHHCPGCRCDR